MRIVACFCLLSFASFPSACSQTNPSVLEITQPGSTTFDLIRNRENIVALDGLWHFHPGDDPDGSKGWAKTDFDDSSWPLLRSNAGWNTQGYKGMTGFGWYRFSIRIPAGARPQALYFPRIMTSYQIFADGREIGSWGGMPPHEQVLTGATPIVVLPAIARSAPATVTIAIRIWHWPYWASYYGGGPLTPGYAGEASLIEQQRAAYQFGMNWTRLPVIFSLLIYTLGGLVALAFAAQQRREREYLWFALWLFCNACVEGIRCWQIFLPIDVPFREIATQLAATCAYLALFAFYYDILKGKKDKLFWIAVIIAPLRPLAHVAAMLGFLPNLLTNFLSFVGTFPIIVWILILLLRRARQGFPDARLLLAPTLLIQGVYIAGMITWDAFALGFTHGSIDLTNFFHVTLPPFIHTLFIAAMLVILVGRITRTRRQEERLSSELEAARTVQQIMIPDRIPSVPGFKIESVYKPYGEVGGDFFQIVPLPGNSILVCIGDVSGKGMSAAMTVSLLVGTLLTLVDTSESPARLLSGMNRRALSRSSGGFTTCLILHADSNGAVTIANAGHVPPYRNGESLPLENCLPLGILEDSVYTESTFQLAPGDQLTLLTDGVLEATSSTGELFGFDRTAAISSESAESIAQAAQAFGQDDDITVLTIALRAIEVAHA